MLADVMVAPRLVLKLGMVRFATSLLVVLLVNVLSRVLIVELAVPAALITFSFAFQHVMTPVGLITGYLSDRRSLRGRRRAPYIWGGMLLSIAVMPFFPSWALALGLKPHSSPLLALGVLLFSLFGIGTTISATAINALLVDRIPAPERGSALTMVWILTLLGFVAGSIMIGALFPAFDPTTLRTLFAAVSLTVAALTFWGAWGVEPRETAAPAVNPAQWGMRPTLVFLATNRQTLFFFAFLGGTIFFLALHTFLLAPYGGEVLGLDLAHTSRFGVYTTYGILAAMVGGYFLVTKQRWGGKSVLAASLIAGAVAFGFLSLITFSPRPGWAIYALCLLGLARGIYNVGISHLTMSLAHPSFSGVFMGLWNLISGLALAAGEMAGGLLQGGLFTLTGTNTGAYGWVFVIEGVGLLACLALLAPINLARYRPQLAFLEAGQGAGPYQGKPSGRNPA